MRARANNIYIYIYMHTANPLWSLHRRDAIHLTPCTYTHEYTPNGRTGPTAFGIRHEAAGSIPLRSVRVTYKSVRIIIIIVNYWGTGALRNLTAVWLQIQIFDHVRIKDHGFPVFRDIVAIRIQAPVIAFHRFGNPHTTPWNVADLSHHIRNIHRRRSMTWTPQVNSSCERPEPEARGLFVENVPFELTQKVLCSPGNVRATVVTREEHNTGRTGRFFWMAVLGSFNVSPRKWLSYRVFHEFDVQGSRCRPPTRRP